MAPKIDGKKTLKREMRTAIAKERDALIRQKEREERRTLMRRTVDAERNQQMLRQAQIMLAAIRIKGYR